MQVSWDLRAEEPLEYSCVIEALMSAWVNGDLPAPAAEASIPYAHQVSHSCTQCSTVCLLEYWQMWQQRTGPALWHALPCPDSAYPAVLCPATSEATRHALEK